ncbi:P-loop NTPase fold protein [Pseudomonas sp. B19125]|uniref:P-loop NTPase fold protein n=1 Tax=Pseudomonas sp. B19125 TaxID=3235109 RepID=UPI0037838A52
MSVAVEEKLLEFASHKKGEAIILKGGWGVGKTHLWESIVKENKTKFCSASYSYVSLFGLNSLKDLKQAIYQNLVGMDKAELSGNAVTVKDGADSISRFFRKNVTLLSGMKQLELLVEAYQSSAINNVLVCLDDFERKGKGLADGEVLGFVSFLIEKRNCKVVLILNEDEHASVGDEFASYREKVFGYELEYKPSSRDCALLVFDGGGVGDAEFVSRITKLDIRNIRLIGKIKYYYDYILSKVNVTNDKILSDIRCVLPLAILARYAGSQSPIELSMLLKFDGWIASPLSDASAEEMEVYKHHEKQADAMRSYGYLSTSQLDVAVINLVLKGYVDQEDLDAVVLAANESLRASSAEYMYNSAWMSFHSKLGMSQDDFFGKFDLAVDAYLEYLNVDRLSSIVRLYRDLDLDEKADSVIQKFFEMLSRTRSLPDRRALWEEPKDGVIRKELDSYFESFGTTMSLEQAVDFLLSKRSTAEAVSVLAKSTESDYYSYFVSPGSNNFKEVIKFLLGASHSSNVFEDAVPGSANKIFIAVYGALRRVRSVSRLNEIRLSPLMEYDDLYGRLASNS